MIKVYVQHSILSDSFKHIVVGVNIPLPPFLPDLTKDSRKTPHISQKTELSSLSKVQMEHFQYTFLLTVSLLFNDSCGVAKHENKRISFRVVCQLAEAT